jgi:hypothetical protein
MKELSIEHFGASFLVYTGRPTSHHQPLFFPKHEVLPIILLKDLTKFQFFSFFDKHVTKQTGVAVMI